MNYHFVCPDCGSDDVIRCGAFGYVYCNMCDAVVEAEIETDVEEDEE